MNMAPGGFYNFYEFSDYRKPRPLHSAVKQLYFRTVAEEERLQCLGQVVFQPTFDLYKVSKANPTAVIETDGRLSFWAPEHATGQPDFHNSRHWQDISFAP